MDTSSLFDLVSKEFSEKCKELNAESDFSKCVSILFEIIDREFPVTSFNDKIEFAKKAREAIKKDEDSYEDSPLIANYINNDVYGFLNEFIVELIIKNSLEYLQLETSVRIKDSYAIDNYATMLLPGTTDAFKDPPAGDFVEVKLASEFGIILLYLRPLFLKKYFDSDQDIQTNLKNFLSRNFQKVLEGTFSIKCSVSFEENRIINFSERSGFLGIWCLRIGECKQLIDNYVLVPDYFYKQLLKHIKSNITLE